MQNQETLFRFIPVSTTLFSTNLFLVWRVFIELLSGILLCFWSYESSCSFSSLSASLSIFHRIHFTILWIWRCFTTLKISRRILGIYFNLFFIFVPMLETSHFNCDSRNYFSIIELWSWSGFCDVILLKKI